MIINPLEEIIMIELEFNKRMLKKQSEKIKKNMIKKDSSQISKVCCLHFTVFEILDLISYNQKSLLLLSIYIRLSLP